MAKRQTISKKIRFELFKRDSFQCQYCGRSAPDVILEPDHINPVSNGGDNELINLITSCFDCNRGKGANLLNDKSVIDKQRKQLQELNERRNQLEMMLAWRESLKDLDEQQIDIICSTWHEACEKRSSLNELGRHEVRKLLKKYQIA
ncbi:MAG TPA: HNH endonuclease, partial [Methylotenera sp.]|nr:HNH endonuclease [Methylotenera sp.]